MTLILQGRVPVSSRMSRSCAILFVLAATGTAADAQSNVTSRVPFETVSVSLGAAIDVRRSANLNGWDPSPGIDVRALFPFYAGTVELGATQSSFESTIAAVPGFRARYIFVGWGAGLRPVRPLTWRAGARLGVYDLQFDDETLPDYTRSENEFAAELVSDLDMAIGRGWSIVAGGGGRVVFTEPRMRQFTISAAVRRTFISPEWLRDFLD